MRERLVSLLPGSYKLWRDHFAFSTSLLEDDGSSGALLGGGSSAAAVSVKLDDGLMGGVRRVSHALLPPRGERHRRGRK